MIWFSSQFDGGIVEFFILAFGHIVISLKIHPLHPLVLFLARRYIPPGRTYICPGLIFFAILFVRWVPFWKVHLV